MRASNRKFQANSTFVFRIETPMELERYSEHLIRKVSKGDQKALNELFGLWYERVYNTAWKYFGEEETAMDMCQQTFIAIHKKISTLQDASKFKFWLYRTVINHCHMESRKRKSRANLKEKNHPISTHCSTRATRRNISSKRTIKNGLGCVTKNT